MPLTIQSGKKRVKILHFIYGLHVGGAETFITNIVRNLDANRFKFEFALQDANISNKELLEIIEERNIKVNILPRFPRHIFSQFAKLKQLLVSGKYDVVHIHSNAAVNPVPLWVANCLRGGGLGNKTRFILHSHNSSNNSGGYVGKLVHYFNSRLFIGGNIIKVACSDLAGRWMFGKSEFSVLDNAIDIRKYSFNERGRKKIRGEFGINDSTRVIGNVGRFVYAKNHRFMIDFFADYSKSHPDSVLLLVGVGQLQEEVKAHARNLGLEDRVIFAGLRTDIPDLLSAMDCFLFPSHFEGLGFVAVEAEATGLRVVASDTIPKDTNQQNYVDFLSLKKPITAWSKAVEDSINKTTASDRRKNPIAGSKYDIRNMIAGLEAIYRM